MGKHGFLTGMVSVLDSVSLYLSLPGCLNRYGELTAGPDVTVIDYHPNQGYKDIVLDILLCGMAV